ncbi:IS200/IS605 family transposase [Parathermosynechococcus lividus]
MSTEYTRLKIRNHSAYSIFYHIVLSIKYRHKALTKDMLDRLEEIFRYLLTKWECELIEFGGESDHVHLLIDAHPMIQPANLVKNLKSVSSRRMRQEYSDYLKQFFWKPYFWSRAYSCISVGGRASIQTLLAYVEDQASPDDPRPSRTDD